MGPVESIKVVTDDVVTLVVLGQAFTATADATESLGLGDYVVAGSDGGESSAIVYSLGTPYVPGVSTVGIKGTVAKVDPALGTAIVGSTALDYTAELAVSPDGAPVEGALIEAIGIQPNPQGTVIIGLRNDGASIVQESVDVSGLRQSGDVSGEPIGSDRL
jgi:hypothetical protein